MAMERSIATGIAPSAKHFLVELISEFTCFYDDRSVQHWN